MEWKSQNISSDVVLLSIGFIFSTCGLMLDLFDVSTRIDDVSWYFLHSNCMTLQTFGFALLAAAICPYKKLNLKVALTLLCFWRFSVFIINLYCLDKQLSIYSIGMLNSIYLLWFLRFLPLRHIKDIEPLVNEAFYIFLPINSVFGLLQAIFLPWHHPRYETRMISDGIHIWNVHHGKFCKTPIAYTDLDKINAVRVPLNIKLSDEQCDRLNTMVGKKAVIGIRDCRKLLIK